MSGNSLLSFAGASALAEACLTLDEVAELLGVSVRSVQRLIAERKLRKVPLARSPRIAPSEFARFIAGRPHPDETTGDG